MSKLKSQYADKFNDLNKEEFVVKETAENSYPFNDRALLLKDYFRGRDDVYAKMWVNNRTGKRGYSPVCKNEWMRSLCRVSESGILQKTENALFDHLIFTIQSKNGNID